MGKERQAINFITAYRRDQKAQKKPAGARKKWLPVLIAALLVAAFLAVFLFVKAGNLERQRALDRKNAEVAGLMDGYTSALALSSYVSELETMVGELEEVADNTVQPRQLDRGIFEQILACAGEKFTVSVYRFDETTRVLEIDAAADSVNDVPQFVEDLRHTNLFASVQYVGYTSDTDGVYYCTVGCVLSE